MAQTKDRTAIRRELRTNHPDTWIAVDPDDTIKGLVTDVTLAWSDVQDQGKGDGWYPLLTVEATEATGYDDLPTSLKVHGMGAVLQGELIRAEAAPGEVIQIVYVGTGTSKVKGRNAPELYKVQMPERDPKDVAQKVYGSLQHKVRRPVAPEAQTDDDTDNGSQQEDIPF